MALFYFSTMTKLDLKQVMALIRSGEWIKSIRCFTCDFNTRKAGQIIEYKNVRIARRKTMLENNAPVDNITGNSKDARHNFHFTINLEFRNGQIRKVHPILIFEINKQPVL